MSQDHLHRLAVPLPGEPTRAAVLQCSRCCHLHVSPSPSLPSHPKVCGLVLLGVGVWLEVVDQVIVQAIQNSVFLVGPYLLIAVGAAIVVVALLGIFGAACQKKCNRVLLILVSPTGRVGCVVSLADLTFHAVHCDRVLHLPGGDRGRHPCLRVPCAGTGLGCWWPQLDHHRILRPRGCHGRGCDLGRR